MRSKEMEQKLFHEENKNLCFSNILSSVESNTLNIHIDVFVGR